MRPDRADVVAGYWRFEELLRGDRNARLSADRYLWAFQEVDRAVAEHDDDVLELLDDLLVAPGADLASFAAGPLEDLLRLHPKDAVAVAVRCRQHPAWMQALQGVWLDAAERNRLEALESILPPR